MVVFRKGPLGLDKAYHLPRAGSLTFWKDICEKQTKLGRALCV
jgi:hypothetical protein